MAIASPDVGARPRLDTDRIRGEFPILDQQVNGHPLVYLDSAATSQKPRAVIRAIEEYYRQDNANVHRGLHELSRRSTEVYEEARRRTADFFGIADPAELILTRGTTEALNLVAWAWGLANLRGGDEILLTVMEHHSNLVPWQLVAERTGAVLRFLDIDDEGRLALESLDELLTRRTRLVSVVHVSNTLGTINPVAEIAERARAVGALVVVDGAQSSPHFAVDVGALGCDFFAFSGHKMYGPTGIGGLWARRELLDSMPPFMGGGEMIDRVELDRSTYAALPHKFEAGTPNIAGAAGLRAAVDVLNGIGMDAIQSHERGVLGYALDRLSDVPGVRIFGPTDPAERSGVISFTLADIHPHDLATILDANGIAVRAGHHCTQPLMRRLDVPATARASFGVYSGEDDVDRLVDALDCARGLFGC